MMNPQIVSVTSLLSQFEDTFDVLIFSISHDARSSIIWSKFAATRCKKLAFYNSNHDYITPHVQKVKEDLVECSLCPLSSDEPLSSFDCIVNTLTGVFRSTPPKSIAVDITCFTRESLAMLILVLHHLSPQDCKITCLYTQAGDYNTAPQDTGHDIWLSRGIRDIRSIMGYRGQVSLRAPTHLIVIPGFEVERAHGIIETMQPNRLTIGKMAQGEDVQPHFSERLDKMTSRLESQCLMGSIKNVFFSAKDPTITRDNILHATRPEENTIIACLNTKISMVGVCMAAIENESIQLIYAQPIEYNMMKIAQPGANVSYFELR